jgi:hypothetical protein
MKTKSIIKITFSILWTLVMAMAATQARAQDKAASQLDKVLIYASDYEAYGKVETIDLAKYTDTKQYVRQQKMAAGYCYRFFVHSTASGALLKLEAQVDGEPASESVYASWAFADACLEGKAAAKVRVTISWKDKGSKIAYAALRKPLQEAATKDDILRNLKAANYVDAKDFTAVPVTGFARKKKWIELDIDPAGGLQNVFIVPGKDLKKFSARLMDKKAVLDSAESTGAYVKLEPKAGAKGAGDLKVKIRADEGEGIFYMLQVKKGGGPIAVGGKSSTDLLAERIVHFVKKLSPGMETTGEKKFLNVGAGEKEKTVTLPVKAGICYRMAAAGDPKIASIAFEVAVSKKDKVEGKPYKEFVMADFCPKKAGKVKIRIKGEGEGYVAFVTFAGASDAMVYAAAGSALDLGRLLARLDEAVDKYGEKMEPADTPTTGMVKLGETATLQVKLDKDFCYKFVAVSTCKEKCGLELLAKEGAKDLAKEKSGSDEAVVEFCPGKAMTATASIKVPATERGKEAFAFMPLRKKAKSKLKVYAAGEAKTDYLSKKIIEESKKSCKGKSAVSPVKTKKLKTNESAVFEVKLAGEVCYTIVAVGNPSVKDIKVTFINPIGQEIAADSESGPLAVVSPKKCPQWDGTYKVKVKMFNGYGDVGMQVFADQ